MVGNAHLDPVWFWRWQEGFQEAKATFRSALDRMKEYNDFVFTSSSAALYEWVEHNDPAMFEEIRERVREGRWVLEGGWWIQPDCNIPSGESLVRQSLYGQRYFYEKFGVISRTGYNVDSFGHNNGIPQILKKSGMDSYVFMRPMPGEKSLPGRIFLWEGPDGSRVTAFQIMFEYLSWPEELDLHVSRCLAETDRSIEETMIFYGVGNHGGGPTRENIESIRRLQEELQDTQLVFGAPDDFFCDLAAKDYPLPVVHDDLQHHSSGCYSAHSGIKRLNRRAENRLLAAEKYAVLAEKLCGHPAADLSRAWKNLLFNQFHDIMAGTCAKAAYEDAVQQLGETLSLADRSLNDSLQSLSWRIRIEEDPRMRPVVLFNPHTWPVSACVEYEYSDTRDSCLVTDETGTELPCQLVQPSAAAINRRRIVFCAELPALGYRTYHVFPGEGQVPKKNVASSPYILENEYLRIVFDPQTGYLREVIDKENQVSLFSGPASIPTVIEDLSDTWSHDVRIFDNRCGTFSLDRIRRVEDGPVRSRIRVSSSFGASRMTQDFILNAGSHRLEVSVRIDWHEKQRMLKLFFPVNIAFPTNTYESSYTFITREGNGEEEPYQNWFDVSGLCPETGKSFGVSLLNDGKYSLSVKNNEIGFTVLRSPIYAHHTPFVPDPEEEYSYIDQGEQEFRYAILPHAGNWREGSVVRAAYEFNMPPELIPETYHPGGTLLETQSFFSCSAENVIIHVLKKSENGKAILLRGWETVGAVAEAEISLPLWDCRFYTKFAPGEIKTFLIEEDGSVKETNLIEGIGE